MPYVTREELTEKCNEIKDDIKQIRDNDLHSIEAWILYIEKNVDHLRWYILGASALLGIILAILEVRG